MLGVDGFDPYVSTRWPVLRLNTLRLPAAGRLEQVHSSKERQGCGVFQGESSADTDTGTGVVL